MRNAHFSPRRAASAFAAVLRDPDQLPEVFALVQALRGNTPQRLVRRMRTLEAGRRLLAERPDIVPLLADRERLRALSDGSLGRAYLAFVESEHISAEGIIAAEAEGRVADEDDDPEVAWFERRMRDTHDLWHALTGYQGDVLGEAALLGFLLVQTKNLGVAALIAGALYLTRHAPDARRVILDGARRGREAVWLPAVEWEALLGLPLEEVRERLGVGEPARYTPVRSSALKERAAA